MSDTNDRFEGGKQMFGEVYGAQVPLPGNAAEHPFQRLMLENLFNDIWGRDTMSVRDRRLILIGVIAAVAGDPSMLLEIQFKSAIEKGELKAEQLREIPLLLTQYIGYPRTVPVMYTVEKVLASLDADKKA
jgi:4-carboxymuconolactone decarboxylase